MVLTGKTDMVTLKGRTDVAHIPYQPLWLLIIRGFQLLLAIIILGLSAYAGSGYAIVAGYGIGIFSFVWTLLFICYIEISTFFLPVAYNKYAHLVLEILSVIFWLSTFASLAVVAASDDFLYAIGYSGYNGYSGYACIYTACKRDDYYTGPANATKAAAALGAIEWALFIGTLITYGIYLHRHRRAVRDGQLAGIQGNAVVEEHKMQPIVQQQPVDPRYQQQTAYQPVQQQQGAPYGQQPYQQQSVA